MKLANWKGEINRNFVNLINQFFVNDDDINTLIIITVVVKYIYYVHIIREKYSILSNLNSPNDAITL